MWSGSGSWIPVMCGHGAAQVCCGSKCGSALGEWEGRGAHLLGPRGALCYPRRIHLGGPGSRQVSRRGRRPDYIPTARSADISEAAVAWLISVIRIPNAFNFLPSFLLGLKVRWGRVDERLSYQVFRVDGIGGLGRHFRVSDVCFSKRAPLASGQV